MLIPLPSAADDHQRLNAEALEGAGAGVMLLQSNMTGASLAKQLLSLAADRELRQRMGTLARGLAKPDAARVIADRALELAEGR